MSRSGGSFIACVGGRKGELYAQSVSATLNLRPLFAMRVSVWMILWLIAAALKSANAGVIIEGLVPLPPAKPAAGAASRYQQKSGTVALPEPPAAIVYLEGAPPAGPVANAKAEVVKQ